MALSSQVPLTNSTEFPDAVFLLMGIPGLEYAHLWISIPFCIAYIIAFVANSFILFIIKTEESLHSPMFFFLCMLAGADLVLINTILPKGLGIFWLNSHEISMTSCVIQMYIAHVFTLFESGVLSLMALDCYIAICNPLRYKAILTNRLTAMVGLGHLLKCALMFPPYPHVVKRLSYCRSNIISHTYCEQMSVAKLACSDITVNAVYGLSVILLMLVSDISLIFFSYVMILKTVTSLSTHTRRWKAISTCTSHVCVMLVFYSPIFCTILIQRFSHSVRPQVHIILANVYFLIPPVANPIVYAIRTRQIRVRIMNLNFRINVFSQQARWQCTKCLKH